MRSSADRKSGENAHHFVLNWKIFSVKLRKTRKRSMSVIWVLLVCSDRVLGGKREDDKVAWLGGFGIV